MSFSKRLQCLNVFRAFRSELKILVRFATTSSSKNAELPKPKDPIIKVYVDGSSVFTEDGKRVGGAGVFWGEDHPLNLAQPLLSVLDESEREVEVTNNRAELMAAIIAVQNARKLGVERLSVRTDSEIVAKGMTIWIKAWMKNDWRKAGGGKVMNRRLFLLLWVATKQLDYVGFEHVRGHSGDLDNDQAHSLATEGAQKALEMHRQGIRPNISDEAYDEDDEDEVEDVMDDEHMDEDTWRQITDSGWAPGRWG